MSWNHSNETYSMLSSYGILMFVALKLASKHIQTKLSPIRFEPLHDKTNKIGERGGSVVECRTPEREVGGSKPTAAVLCPWARHFTPRKYWLITQEALAPSRHDWKIVDWDIKPQHKQTNKMTKLRSAWASAQPDKSSQWAQWVAKDSMLLHTDNKDSDQTGQMPRVIWVFVGHTCHFVGFVMQWLIVWLFQQWSEAAVLYEQGGFYDKAASVYIRGKNW